MRGAFAKTLTELARQDERIVLLTGDLGYMALEPFADAFPDRFYNVGVAEQNMIGIATGLAEAGLIPFAYSITPFAVLRPYEFIRNGPVAHQLPVRIVGVGGGVEYGLNGLSHFGVEDLAVMRAQPALTTIAPADSKQTTEALKATWNLPTPIYFRLGKDDSKIIAGLDGKFEIDRCQTLGTGKDLLIISTGAITLEAVAAAELLNAEGVATTIAIVSSFNPTPEEHIQELLSQFERVLTVESHYTVGGLWSCIGEIALKYGLRNFRADNCAIGRMPVDTIGSQQYVQEQLGISKSGIFEKAMRLFAEEKCPARV